MVPCAACEKALERLEKAKGPTTKGRGGTDLKKSAIPELYVGPRRIQSFDWT